MPLYDYRCAACGKVTEVRHGFSETYADPCPACGGALQRVFSPAPIVFKGSGFYVTDSRGKKTGEPAKPAEQPAASASETPAAAGASEPTAKAPEGKPADSKPAGPKESAA